MNLRRYIRRKKAQAQIRLQAKTPPIRVVVGAGGLLEPGWINTDLDSLNLLKAGDWSSCFKKDTVDAILAEHVWEHLTAEDGLRAARQCFAYLKPSGYLRLAVPDGGSPNPSYINCVKPGGTGDGADDHKVLYNHITFTELLAKAGFRVSLLEYFDLEGQFHAVDWNPAGGKIWRSRRFDERNADGGLNYTSLILDAYKDAQVP